MMSVSEFEMVPYFSLYKYITVLGIKLIIVAFYSSKIYIQYTFILQLTHFPFKYKDSTM